MANIVNFRVEGLAGRKWVFEKSLENRLSIFFGQNGCGKTTLLKIFDSALRRDSYSTIRMPFTSAEIVLKDPRTNTTYTISIDKSEALRLHEKDLRHYPPHMRRRKMREMLDSLGAGWTVDPKGNEEPVPWTHKFLPIARMFDIGKDPEASSETDVDKLDTAYERMLERHWFDYYSEVQAGIRSSQEKCITDILRTVVARRADLVTTNQVQQDPEDAYSKTIQFLRRQAPREVLADFDWFREQLETDPVFAAVVNRISFVEEEIAFYLSPSNQLSQLINNSFSGQKKVRFRDRGVDVLDSNGVNIGLRSLSSGEKQFLYLLLESTKVGSGILMIDEPELSMHIDWQRSFISSVFEMNESCQLILATHSPDVMADYEDRYIHEIPV